MRSSTLVENEMRGSGGGRKEKSQNGEDVERKSIFGRYSNEDMLAQIKRLALDPRNKDFSRDKIQPLYNQIMRVRKTMTLSNTTLPRRKRNLELFCKDKLRAAPGTASVQDNVTKVSRGQLTHASSASCLLNSADSAGSFDQKFNPESCTSASFLTFENNTQDRRSSFLDDGIDWRRSSAKHMVPDSDDSVNGSNPLTPENLNNQEAPSLDLFDAIHKTNSPYHNAEMQKNLHTPQRSIRKLNVTGDHVQKKVVPVNQRFQAVVPEWTGPVGSEDDSRWLGTCIWPVDGQREKITEREVGEGRPDSCSCLSPGSTDCTKRHIAEERLHLLSDLGSPFFFGCKFNEMGEEVAKSWTEKEQETFEALMKNRKDLLKHAVKSFPRKSKKDVVSYYLNVFIPRRISMRTRLSREQVDSEEDEADDGFNYMNSGKRSEGSVTRGGGSVTHGGGSVTRGGSKAVKTLYLRQ